LSREPTAEVVLDAGAFIAFDRNDQRVRALVELGLRGGITLRTSSGVVAQVWRGGARGARLARLLGSGAVDERPLDPHAARRIGLLAADTGRHDVVDGHVASLALARRTRVVTSDPDDLLGWGLPVEAVIRC
jgi:predicted nucleic acid-binding protein